MLVYRIARTEFIQDLSGYGAKLNGGRWNREGVSVLYTGSNLSLCAWEYWVHLPAQVRLNQRTFSAAIIYTPDDSIRNMDSLVEGWQQNESSLHEITDDWINEGEFLMMRVPSAVIAGEFNLLVNPVHSLFPLVHIQSVTPFRFDDRAFGRELVQE